jgi:hypothetical protein
MASDSITGARLVVYNCEYVPGTPITWDLIEALVVRVVGEFSGLIDNSGVHCALQFDVALVADTDSRWQPGVLETYEADLSAEGVEFYWADTEDNTPWVTRKLCIELDPEKLASPCDLTNFWGMYGASRVTRMSLLKRALGIPLNHDEFLCTDFIQYHLDPKCWHKDPDVYPQGHWLCGVGNNYDHWTPKEAAFYAYMNSTPEDVVCPTISITQLVRPVARPTTWQFMFMGMVTALGVGNIIRKTPSMW